MRALRIHVAALLIVAISLLTAAAPAAAATKLTTWSNADSNKLKSYTYNMVAVSCPFSYTVRMEVELGTVTSTSAYVKAVRYWYSNYRGLEYIEAEFGDSTWVQDEVGNRKAYNDSLRHPLNGHLSTFTVGRTFRFNNSTQDIWFYRNEVSAVIEGCSTQMSVQLLVGHT